jgi:hypothetical protein
MVSVTGDRFSPAGASTCELVARQSPGSAPGAGSGTGDTRCAYVTSGPGSTVATGDGEPRCQSTSSTTTTRIGTSDHSSPVKDRPGPRGRAAGAGVWVLTGPLSRARSARMPG